ncbi:hypothetical protein ACFE04_021735 [Oxalis oulophora]
MKYVAGKKTTCSHLAHEVFIEKIRDAVLGIGYTNITKLRYKHPDKSMKYGLRKLENEYDILSMLIDIGSHNSICIYAEGCISRNIIVRRKKKSPMAEAHVYQDYLANGEEELDMDDEKIGNVSGLDEDEFMFEEVEEEEGDISFLVYGEDSINGDIPFAIGMYFYNLEDAKEAIMDYAVSGGYNVHFKKSDKDRVRAECVQGCPWFMLVSRVGKLGNFRLKTLNAQHNYGRSNTNKLARNKKLTPTIMCNPKITSHQGVNLVKEKWMIDIVVNMAYRVRSQEKSMQDYKGIVCPKVHKRLEHLKKNAILWLLDRSENNTYSVRGLPFSHAIACILRKNEEPENYVHTYYKSETFLKIYGGAIYGTNGKEQWPKSNTLKLEAPTFVKKRGRPQRKRKKQPGEETNKDDNRNGQFQTCSKCNLRGHSKRTCTEITDEEDTTC